MIHRRALLASAAALPFLRNPARAATTPGKLVFGLSAYPPSLNPFANAGTAAATAKLAMHRGLLGYAPDGTLRGELAETWEHADDGAWVFHLRDASFHNGNPLTSADIAWTVDQVAGEKSTAYLRAEMQGIARVETPDPKTVRFVTKNPNAAFPYPGCQLFPADHREGHHRCRVPGRSCPPRRSVASRWNLNHSRITTAPACRA